MNRLADLLFSPKRSVRMRLMAVVVCALALCAPAFAAFVINPNFTANFNTNFGANAAAAQAAWIAAASIFTANFTDNITVNITVDAVAGTGVFGQSNTFLISNTYATTRTAMVNDATTPDDLIATGAGGSVSAADPVGGTHTWWTSRAQAKALGLIASDGNTDGTTTFGAGNPFTFSGAIAAGTFDFRGVAAHEISEVLGRLGISGGTIGNNINSFSVADLFSYSGAGVRVLGAGPNSNFSIDNGTNLLKLFNNALVNGLDTRDWAPGTNDAFNQFSNSGVTNPVSDVDLRYMDVIGYDRVATPTPEPVSAVLLIFALASGGIAHRFRRKQDN
jgi:hypothetical protein